MKGQNLTRTHAGAWNMIAGTLSAAGVAVAWTGVVIDQAGLLAASFIALALSIAATWVADRDLGRLLDAVAAWAREQALGNVRAQRHVPPAVADSIGRPEPVWGPPARTRGASPRAPGQNAATGCGTVSS